MKYLKTILLLFLCILCLTPAYADDKDARRQAFIKDFIDYYRAAYQKEKISYIEEFFSNDALIITETKQLIKSGSEIIPSSNKKRPYHSLVENRKQYISRLKEYFKTNDKINIGISNVIIKRHPKYPEIYGVHFFQIWNDSGAAKILENQMPGYIFMMIDFRDNELEPTVHVRTWQPKDNITTPADKYTLSDFRIL